MTSDDRKAWDARLVAWMSRGSSEASAGGKRTWTPKQRAAYGVFLAAWLSLLVATNARHVEWWPFPAIVVVVIVTQVGLHLWERKRRA